MEVVHKSMKYVPFTGLEVNSDVYFEIMSSLIQPDDPSSEDPAAAFDKFTAKKVSINGTPSQKLL